MIPLLLLTLAGCFRDGRVEPWFEGPAAAVVLHPDDGGPFFEPVALISNSRSGTIMPVDVKHGWLLATDPIAPFVPTPPLATGADRILGQLAVTAPDNQTVTAWVADALTETLLEVPWIEGVEADGAPTLRPPELVAGPDFVDADGSGDSATLEGLELRHGAAATEDWTLTFDGEGWAVEGSRSGLQQRRAFSLQTYATDDDSLSLLISGSATEGDQLTLSVDNGVVEHDLGGFIEELHPLPSAGWLLATVVNRDEGVATVEVFEPSSRSRLGSLTLPEGARPGRIHSDPEGLRVFIGDLDAPTVWIVEPDLGDPAASTVEAMEVSGRVAELVQVEGEDYDHLFVAPVGQNLVEVIDLSTGEPLDVNPATAEIDAIDTQAPVTGMAATREEVLLQETGPWGARAEEQVVVISTFEGVAMMAEARTGCLAQDDDGPYALLDGESGFLNRGATSDPEIVLSDSTSRAVQVSPCGGLVRNEAWSATYDEADGSWIVEGSVSGVQSRRAYEDQRYLSDDGQVSFLILAGALPSTNGDQFNFRTYRGVSEIDGDINGDGIFGEFRVEVPARPVITSYLAGPTGGGWDEVNRKTMGIWPVTNADQVIRLNLKDAEIDDAWQ